MQCSASLLFTAAQIGDMATLRLVLRARERGLRYVQGVLEREGVSCPLANALLITLASGQLGARDGAGATAVHHAAASGQAGAVRVLLEAGLDANARAHFDFTPLHAGESAGVSLSNRSIFCNELSRSPACTQPATTGTRSRPSP